MEEVEAIFAAFCQEIQDLTKIVADLQNQVAQLTQQPAPLVQQVVQAPQPMSCRKCFVAMPENFGGDRCQFPAFLSQLQLFINAQLAHFSMNAKKVAFLCSLLASPAAAWVSPLLDCNDPLLQDYTTFYKWLWRQYADLMREQTAMRH
ncbi:protein LDOC1-like [Erythrolamprus reginae]|uniref:protein LDOC1-like n=1 Tax=Erythrolamprus reginae TaxID=121349 RepID=UPI00396C6C63